MSRVLQISSKTFPALIVTITLCAVPLLAQVSVLTQDYDINRSGANLRETILTPSAVTPSSFGKLFSYAVDEVVMAQPLYVPGLTINGSTHNVVFIVRSNDSVYAFDANSPSLLWHTSVGSPVPSSKYLSFGYGPLGITGTPVIDLSTGEIYFVAALWNSAAQSASQELFGLSIYTGSVEHSTVISATGFNPDSNFQRPGLLLLNGVLYVAFGSHADLRSNIATQQNEAYYGMILAYNESTLAQVYTPFNAVASGQSGGSIWQAGRGPASDGNYIFVTTANAWPWYPGSGDYSESIVKLNPNLSVNDHYQDPASNCLNSLDEDLSSSGPTVIPGSSYVVGGGKAGSNTSSLLSS